MVDTTQAVRQAFDLWMRSRNIKIVCGAFVLMESLLLAVGGAAEAGGARFALALAGIPLFSKVMRYVLSWWLRAATLAQTDRHLASIFSGRVMRIMLAGLLGIVISGAGSLLSDYKDQLPLSSGQVALLGFLALFVGVGGALYANWHLLAASQDDAHPKGSFWGFVRHSFDRIFELFLLVVFVPGLIFLLVMHLFSAFNIFTRVPFVALPFALLWVPFYTFIYQIYALFLLVLYREYQALPARKR